MRASATASLGFAFDRTEGLEEWLTPPYIINALGPFDLDPCAPITRLFDTARSHYTINDDGLSLPWQGRIWLNPPYGDQTTRWVQRLAEHGNGIALIFARTETATFFPWVWEHASAVLFLRGRVKFYNVDGTQGGTAGAPSCLIAYGENNAIALEKSGLDGRVVDVRRVRGGGA